MRSRDFLLIDGDRDPNWRSVLDVALAHLGTLYVGDENEAGQLVLKNDYDLIIVDAMTVKNVPLLISRVKALRPDARVVVASSSPTWRRAREAFQAGATDYVRKSPDTEEISQVLRASLDKVPSPWPR